MKLLRPMLVPTACFALAWATTFLVSRRVEPPPATGQQPPRLAAPKPRADHDRPHYRAIAEVAESFRARPIAEWPGIWEDFAAAATVADLEALAATTQVPRHLTERRNARNVPRMLALEELAARSDRPPADVPGAYATLAERDPEAAWQRLGRHPRSDLTIAVVRTLARHDPAGTLRRIQAMPAPLAHGRSYETDAGEGGMGAGSPLRAVFAAWARSDPAAAAAAVRQLPPADRPGAAGQVALTWAFRDGPAAIRFLLDVGVLSNPTDSCVGQLNTILRAALRNHGAATARLLADEPALRKAIEAPSGSTMWCIYKPWHDADPGGLLAWVLEEDLTRKDFDDLDATARWNSRSREVLGILDCDPQAAATMIRGLAAAGSNHGRDFLPAIRRQDPQLAAELARELGITLPEELTGSSRLIDENPAQACDLWLAALREHPEPEAALAELRWSKSDATKLADRAARVFPEKAAELARLVPAAALDRRSLGYPRGTADIARFWPDLAAPVPPDPGTISVPAFPASLFQLDPATAAESLLAATPSPAQVKQAVESWAPHDYDAAKAWLARVPDPAARQQGEAALLQVLAARDPAAALRVLTESPDPDTELPRLAGSCLRRIMAAGGDWRGWLERIPPDRRPRGPFLDLEAEARLLERLRKETEG